MTRRRVGRAIAAAAVALFVLATTGCRREPAPLAVPRPTVLSVTMREYDFRFDRSVPTGRVVFEISNEGRRDHDLVLFQLPDDFPPIDQELRNDRPRLIPTVVVVPRIQPGGRGTFAVDLETRRYALVCFVRDPDGAQHATKGMSAEFGAGARGPVTTTAGP